jgi:hypothetical protein
MMGVFYCWLAEGADAVHIAPALVSGEMEMVE